MYMLIDIFHINIHAAKSYNILKESDLMVLGFFGLPPERLSCVDCSSGFNITMSGLNTTRAFFCL